MNKSFIFLEEKTMATRNRNRTVVILAAVAMAILILTATSANAATGITIDDTGTVTLGFASYTLASSYDASGSDKLVVTISMERDRGDPATRIVGVTYNSIPMIEVVQFKDSNNYDPPGIGPAAIFYLDNPGPAGPIVVQPSAKMNGGYASWLALSGTAEGVGPTSASIGASTSITTVVSNSLVVAHNHCNGGITPEPVEPLIKLGSAGWGNNWGDAASGYQFVASAGTVTPTFTEGTTPVTVAAAFESSFVDPNLPYMATDPFPADGVEYDYCSVYLSWTGAAAAAEHDVYFGTSFDDVNDATASEPPVDPYKGRQTDTSYDVSAALVLGTTYYWRIDEVNDPNVWKGTCSRYDLLLANR